MKLQKVINIVNMVVIALLGWVCLPSVADEANNPMLCTEQPVVAPKQSKVEIMYYTQYGCMTASFLAGESEYLKPIKDEKGAERSDSIELWSLSIEYLYLMSNKAELPRYLVNFFLEQTPNMVLA